MKCINRKSSFCAKQKELWFLIILNLASLIIILNGIFNKTMLIIISIISLVLVVKIYVKEKKINDGILKIKEDIEILDDKAHFIFNSINTIKYYCRVDPKNAGDLLVSFSNILNYLLFKKEYNILASEEIESVENYINIENIRFDRDIKVCIDCLDEIVIPKGLIANIIFLGFRSNILKQLDSNIYIYLRNINNIVKLDVDIIFNESLNKYFNKLYLKSDFISLVEKQTEQCNYCLKYDLDDISIKFKIISE
ncbi:two-component sensor histidine kinase [Clostridium fallax]|uniref:Histidine kinase n=2 Tax=Clostridium fallax TaxID=1533 RepID=A0A1M4WEQ6_9CLOT|nr:histidine kinase [Clostridium fallax]SHE79728.1 Histidine kinase [Clostridium fallax]SQB04934.1 two-component sensor histidine kinase [Clostridium fallax]